MENRSGLGLSFGRRILPAAALATMILPLALGVIHAGAQTEGAGTLPRFEVASVKPSNLNGAIRVGVRVYPGGRVVISGCELRALIMIAFRLSHWQISGGDDWTDNVKYEVEAKPSETMQATIKDVGYTLFGIEDEHLRQMLQALLSDRFQLKYHRETKTGDVYLLERSGKTLRLRPGEAAPAGLDPPQDRSSAGSIGYAGGRWRLSNTSMPQLAKFASDYMLGVPVLDRTELSGPLDYWQAVPDDEPAYSGPSHQDSFMNMLSVVGLKLERSRGPVETLVIDKAEKPSPN